MPDEPLDLEPDPPSGRSAELLAAGAVLAALAPWVAPRWMHVGTLGMLLLAMPWIAAGTGLGAVFVGAVGWLVAPSGRRSGRGLAGAVVGAAAVIAAALGATLP